jgi:hypothetical protein
MKQLKALRQKPRPKVKTNEALEGLDSFMTKDAKAKTKTKDAKAKTKKIKPFN